MRRRELLSLGGVAIIGGALRANAQQAPMPIFGILLVFPPSFRQDLQPTDRRLPGCVLYVHGRNIELDFRSSRRKRWSGCRRSPPS